MNANRHVAIAVGFAGFALIAFVILRPPDAREITATLDAAIIPKLSLREAPCTEGVAIVLDHVHRVNPRFRKVEFVSHVPGYLLQPSPGNPTWRNAAVTLELTNVPADDAL